MNTLLVSRCSPSANSGFTLIEVMITVAIIGILSAIAMPAYNDYVIRGRIPDATSGLATKSIQSKRYFDDSPTHTYADVLPAVNPGCQPDTTGRFFDFACTVQTSAIPPNTPALFTIQASGKGPMVGFNYFIDQSGRRWSDIVAPAPTGFRATSPAAPAPSCWFTKKGGQC